MSEYAALNQSPVETAASAPDQVVPHVHEARPPRRNRRLGHLGEWLILLLAVLALLGATGTLFLVFGERDYTGHIYPNISVRGLDLSNYSAAAARTLLEQQHADFLANPVELVYGEQRWRPSAAQVGIELDFDKALNTALTAGRTGTRAENVKTVAAIWEQGMEVPLHVRIDQAAMQRYLLMVAREIETAPRNADIHLQGPEVVLTPEEMGTQLLVDETLHEITAAMQALEPQPIALRTRTLTPVVRNSDIAPVAADLEHLLDGPLMLTGTAGECAHTCTWTWTPEQIAGWIRLERTIDADGRPVVTPVLEQEKMHAALEPLTEVLGEDGTLPRLNWNNGNLAIAQPGIPGLGLNVALAVEQMQTALVEGPRTLDLPLMGIQPPVNETNLHTLGITSLVGSGTSSFRASAGYRITNIRAGSSHMHGLLIPPGAVFSFNNSLGPVTGSRGFVPGLAIVNDRTQKEWGGGLCQVSTTMYRAAFWAGLPIVERHEHSFRIPWYEELGEPPGLDASIYTGALDMRFLNDTGGWLLIQAWVDVNRQRLSFALYGPPTNRTVTMGHKIISRTPRPTNAVYVNDSTLPRGYFRQTDYAQGGMTIETYRVVRQGEQVLWQDTFTTKFKPWPNIYIRGTG
jgi:vancomycin resistance protein YoaR